ncbi:NlpC/P60 family protein [Streptomyces sp. ASQP_92]|uniref:C40 family peptidase n=1 Tax=Streptomyces sp. ASQP_92 TaxID=2979116 RepID=UPI0021BEEB76|nr:NlpC/P60 family protein [Streptomyces sp. ASQP_92]MCT9091180.1 NlpC/P60 family protein [Streptomyces sp. ASQP_92]
MPKTRRLAIAIALVCALTAVAAPGTAFADPVPTPSTTAPDRPRTLDEVSRQIDDLYRRAAAATDAYNLAEEQTKEQSAQIVRLAQDIVKGQEKIKRLKDQAGATARMQYRNGGLPPGAQMMLSGDPEGFLDGAGALRQGQQAAQGLLGELNRTQADLAAYSADATAQWKNLEANRVKKEAAKKDITEKIAAAEKLQSQLKEQERERLAELERKKEFDSQTAWLSTGVLKDINGSASEQGRKAVKFVTDQIGKKYIWGAAGPDTFDCSGLTSQAWLAAGHPVPRTSQEQWARLPHVAIKDMRPGDLVIYFADATHVGMYIGDGAIVHAPRPGRTVTITGAGSMPILGVVRPDK